ncbi:MAG: energy-coupling factor ABC transporter ATP-binding protein [Anaerolineae bacterium]|nr:energy-coupling factor ABC transporter ATP-binding protein [Anaerolineae bacterium]
MSNIALSVKNLRFRYRDRVGAALQGVSFSVSRGELLLIAGASGCGKTTLIRAINGLIPRSYKGEVEGQILINGQDVSSLPLSRISQMVGTVLQDPERQILGTKVVNEVAFGLENMGLPRDEILERVDEALNTLRIPHLRERETFLLSGGEKQKVALAGVLAMRPSVLLLDEPLASLDPASAVETLDIVRQLADGGLTVLMVEHRVEDVLRIRPDRILYMKDGAIHYLGDVNVLMDVVDFSEVKLPAEMVISRERGAPPRVEMRPLLRRPGAGESAPAPLVQFENVGFGYDPETAVLKDIALNIQKGDVIAVLGPNGAGKTTFVKHAIGLLKPKSGRVLVNGRDTREASVAEIASTLGYVFQSPSHMLFAPTVHDELAFGPKNLKHKPDEIEAQIKESLKTVNLPDKVQDAPLSLSFGQQKRVSIAAILAMRSKILVMDEPTAGQDYKNYMNFMDAILQMPGFEAILFITHDVDLAAIYANRVILVADGRVQADGKPEQVLADKELLLRCRIIPTSLVDANLARLAQTGRFMRAEALAHV